MEPYRVVIEDEVTVVRVISENTRALVEDAATTVRVNPPARTVIEDEVTVVKFAVGERGRAGPAGPAFSWLAASEDTEMAADTGYIPTSDSARVVLTLPTAVIGSTVKVAGAGLAGWKIVGATVYFGNVSTDGFLQSTDPGDCVELVCIGADWRITSSIGTIEYED